MRNNKLFISSAIALTLATSAAVTFAATQPALHYIPSESMEPTLHLDTYVLVQRNAYRNISQVRRGDIIVHTRFDKRSKKMMESVKRVVGLPGDTVQVNRTRVSINGRNLPHVLLGQIRRTAKSAKTISLFQETNGQAKYRVQYGDNTSPGAAFSGTVPQGQLFCLGDNRDNAFDSRYSGAVPFASVVGKR